MTLFYFFFCKDCSSHIRWSPNGLNNHSLTVDYNTLQRSSMPTMSILTWNQSTGITRHALIDWYHTSSDHDHAIAYNIQPHHTTLENHYGFWPQTGCVTVPGREAAFLVDRQRFPYCSRFNFSVKSMENMLSCNAMCDIMHIDFSRKIYCGANDASIGF